MHRIIPPVLTGGPRLAAAFVALLLLTIARAHAQEPAGALRGKVTDQETGQPVVRATVLIVGTKLGALTDLNGVFMIPRIPPGEYTVRVSYLGFATQETPGVRIGEGVAHLDVVLRGMLLSQDEVVITARGGRGTEQALLNERRKSSNVTDGISMAQLRRLPDATGADALARVTGLSVVGSRFVNIRGVNERYNATQLNGVTMVSTEPGKRAFSFDMIPSSLLENTIVAKTFTPDLPGDFSGGLVQLNTIDFPDQMTGRISLSGSYVDGTTSQGVELGPRGSGDFFGIDNGLRTLPSDFPDTGRINELSYTKDRIASYARQLPNNYRIAPVNAAPNLSFVASYGDRFTLLDNDLGMVAALSYRNGFDKTAIIRHDVFSTGQLHYDYNGTQNQYTTLWGGLLNLSYKLSDLHTIGVKNTFNHASEDELTMTRGAFQTDAEVHSYVFRYMERTFYSGQIVGDHLFPAVGNLRVQWRGFGSLGGREEPDQRRIAFNRPLDDTAAPLQSTLGQQINTNGAGRLYSSLSENLAGGGLDLTLPVASARIKAGVLVENRSRTFANRLFNYRLENASRSLIYASLDTLFEQTHIDTNAITFEETTTPFDNYSGESHLRAGYVMADLPFEIVAQRFRAVAGARFEDNRVIVHTADPNNGDPLAVNYVTSDWLPSLSLIYEVTPRINFRMAYSNTVSRPDFREFARTNYYDFITNALTTGNTSLRRPFITNYDLRFEFFPDAGELMAVSFFHKKIIDAIEDQVEQTSSELQLTWGNTDGTTTGVELELRKSLGFIAELLAPLSFSVNYTWLQSSVESDTVPGKKGRGLQGQSPYIINAGLYYDNLRLGTSVTLAYNRFGERIYAVNRSDRPDLIEQPADKIDLTISQTLFANFELRLNVKDLVPNDKVVTQTYTKTRIDPQTTVKTEEQVTSRASVDIRQRVISLGFTAKF